MPLIVVRYDVLVMLVGALVCGYACWYDQWLECRDLKAQLKEKRDA